MIDEQGTGWIGGPHFNTGQTLEQEESRRYRNEHYLGSFSHAAATV
ncbi:MAG: hypothetical protein NVS9B15_23920 [Acidobacteriaceae bacterium]